MRRCGHARHFLQQLHVFRMTAEFVVSDHCSKWFAAEDAIAFFIHFFENRGLIEFGSPLQIAKQFFLGNIQDLDFKSCARFTLVQQVFQPAPGRLQFLELGVVQNLVQLDRYQVVDLSDASVDHRFGVSRHRHRSFQKLCDEFANQILSTLARCCILAETALIDDLIQETLLAGLSRCLGWA